MTDALLVALGRYCRRLEAFAAQGCDKISDEGCIAMLRGCRDLQSLNLRDVADLTEARWAPRASFSPFSAMTVPLIAGGYAASGGSSQGLGHGDERGA